MRCRLRERQTGLWPVAMVCDTAVAGREKHGDHFGITVSGYPEAHPDLIVEDPAEMDKNYWKDLHYTKEKVQDHILVKHCLQPRAAWSHSLDHQPAALPNQNRCLCDM